MFRSSH